MWSSSSLVTCRLTELTNIRINTLHEHILFKIEIFSLLITHTTSVAAVRARDTYRDIVLMTYCSPP